MYRLAGPHIPQRATGVSRRPASPNGICGGTNSVCTAQACGTLAAGGYVQLAVRRYLDDLEHAHDRGLAGLFSSSDSTGGSVDVDEDGPWDETDPLFYEMHDDAMDF